MYGFQATCRNKSIFKAFEKVKTVHWPNQSNRPLCILLTASYQDPKQVLMYAILTPTQLKKKTIAIGHFIQDRLYKTMHGVE